MDNWCKADNPNFDNVAAPLPCISARSHSTMNAYVRIHLTEEWDV